MEGKQLLKSVVHLKQSMMEVFNISSWLSEVVAIFTKDANVMVRHFVATNFELMKFEKLFDATDLFTEEQFANDPEIMALLYRSSFMGGVIDAHFDRYTKVERENFIQDRLFKRWKKHRERRAIRLYRRGGVLRSEKTRKRFKFPSQKKKKKQKRKETEQQEQLQQEQLLNQPSTSAAALASLKSQGTSQMKQLSKPKRLKEEQAGPPTKKKQRAGPSKQAKKRQRQPSLMDNDYSDWEDVPTEDEISDIFGMNEPSNANSTDDNNSACDTTDDDDYIPPVKSFDVQKRKYNDADDGDNQPSTSSKISK